MSPGNTQVWAVVVRHGVNTVVLSDEMWKHLQMYKAQSVFFYHFLMLVFVVTLLVMKLGLQFQLQKNEMSQKFCKEVSFQIMFFNYYFGHIRVFFLRESSSIPLSHCVLLIDTALCLRWCRVFATRSQKRVYFGKACPLGTPVSNCVYTESN